MAPPAIEATNDVARITSYTASLVTHLGFHDLLAGCQGDELLHRVTLFVHLVTARTCLYDVACANSLHHTSQACLVPSTMSLASVTHSHPCAPPDVAR